MEQEEYTKEEINWSYVEFVDNQDVLDLIEKVCGLSLQVMHLNPSKFHNVNNIYLQKPGGIIALLDEAW